VTHYLSYRKNAQACGKEFAVVRHISTHSVAHVWQVFEKAYSSSLKSSQRTKLNKKLIGKDFLPDTVHGNEGF
jgi:hypothetical protein